MSTPKIVKAWACSRCGAVFRHHKLGQVLAATCCTCRECGSEQNLTWIGTSQQSCGKCWLEKELKDSETDLRRAERRFSDARKNEPYGIKS